MKRFPEGAETKNRWRLADSATAGPVSVFEMLVVFENGAASDLTSEDAQGPYRQGLSQIGIIQRITHRRTT